VGVKEEDIQRAIIQLLELHGFTVHQTSRRGVKGRCPRCHQLVKVFGGDGASKGLPDLMVRKASWPPIVWAGLEVKGPKTRISPEQKALAETHQIAIVRSADEALRFAEAVAFLFDANAPRACDMPVVPK
jgi:hypothetical protein